MSDADRPQTCRPGILAADDTALARTLDAWGQPPYRAAQIRRWIIGRRATRFDEMSDLPRGLRDRLAETFRPLDTRVVRRVGADDQTDKLLVELADGHRIECVLLREGRWRTACLSTQVGCGMGCAFCASGLDGMRRNLQTHEIVEQALHVAALLPSAERLSHVVVMGTGEPLANLAALLPALETLATPPPDGLGVSARHVTISTVGLLDGIRRLAASGAPYSLAISLHAPDDALRRRIVPAARSTPILALVEAGHDYEKATGRQVTYEVVLLADVNDRPDHARRLVRLLGKGAFVNVIPYNPVDGLAWRRPGPDAVRAFCETLRREGLHAKTRKRKGASINAACGQLRLRSN